MLPLQIKTVILYYTQRLYFTYSIGVSSYLHCSKLQPCPAGVKLCGAYESDVNTQGPVNCRAVYTEEHPIGYTGPCWVVAIAVKTCLKEEKKSD